MARTVGCIGCGNMGGAILAGLAASPDNCHSLFGYDISPARQEWLTRKGPALLNSVESLAEKADIIIVAVKPYHVKDVLEQIRPCLNSNKILISLAAGYSMTSLMAGTEKRCPVVRCMPNTPALVGAGIFALCFEDPAITESVREEIMLIFGQLGLCLPMPEAKFTAFSALIGAGPAYVFMMMQGLVQAGITLGFSQSESNRMVSGLFAGSAAMAINSNDHLGKLRDDVCSPAGLTIAGVNHLDRAGLTGILVDAVLAADRRGREMES